MTSLTRLSRLSRGTRLVRGSVALAIAGAVLLTGCGEQQADTAATEPASQSAPAPAPAATETKAKPASAPTAVPEAPATSLTPEPRAAEEGPVPVENMPTELPPGDPGLGAPPVPDPGRPTEDRAHEVPARTVVPDEALLDAQTVSGVLGGDWQRSDGQPLDCLASGTGVADRTVAFRSGEGQVLQTVTTYRSEVAADSAVGALAKELAACGWSSEPDPRLGTASAHASSVDPAQTAVVIAAEGVTVTLVGTPEATARGARWSSLLDLALGNSCAAAAHDCH